MGVPKKAKRQRLSIATLVVVLLCVAGAIATGLALSRAPMLNPQGVIADKQLQLMMLTVGLGVVVIVPVFVMLFVIAWRYREGRTTGTKATYQPNWDNNPLFEGLWWGIPLAIIIILSIVTWHSSHELDPYRPLESQQKPVRIQVVALQWRWLFIYPDYNVASLSEVRFPDNTPVNFEITADAPMNSFWIPQLGGQVYAMTGMSTKLHLQADAPGDYQGQSANISGEGFAGMRFVAKAVSPSQFDTWVQQARAGTGLDRALYDQLAQPSKDAAPQAFRLQQHDLYDTIVMKYMDMGTH